MTMTKNGPRIINGLEQPNDSCISCEFIIIKACKFDVKNDKKELNNVAKTMANNPNINNEDSSSVISRTNVRVSNKYETLANLNELEQRRYLCDISERDASTGESKKICTN